MKPGVAMCCLQARADPYEPVPVAIVAHDELAAVAAIHDVVNRHELAGHADRLPKPVEGVNENSTIAGTVEH